MLYADNAYTLPKSEMGRKNVETLSADIRKIEINKPVSILRKIVHDLDR